MKKKKLGLLEGALLLLFGILAGMWMWEDHLSNKYLKATLPTPTAQWQDLHGDSIKSRQAYAISYFVSKENANGTQTTPNP